MRIAYSKASEPSARSIAKVLETEFNEPVELVRSSRLPVDVNWGRRTANTTLNADISNTVNKRVMRELFKEHGVPMPKLYLTDDVYGLNEIQNLVRAGRKLIGRPDTHSKGRGLWRIDDMPSLLKALKGTRRKKAATHFMEFIEAPREYRVHIFKGKSIRISEKLFGLTGETAHGTYITGKPRHPIGHVREAAKAAVKAVNLDFGTVDILADDERAWVLEVNSAPGLGGTMPRVWAETFLKWKEVQG